MQSIRMKIVLGLALGVFLMALPGSGHAGPKAPAEKTKPAAATPAINTHATALKEAFKRYGGALQFRQLADEIAAVGLRLKTRSNKFPISKVREIVHRRNEVARYIAIWAGASTTTQVDEDTLIEEEVEIYQEPVDTDAFEVWREVVDPEEGMGAMSGMPSMPSFEPPTNEADCASQYESCRDDAAMGLAACNHVSGSYTGGVWTGGGSGGLGRGSRCGSNYRDQGRDCEARKGRCDNCERNGGTDCADKFFLTIDIEDRIKQLIDYIGYIESMIGMQNFTHEFGTDMIDFYNNVVNMTHQMIPQQ